MDAFEKLLRLGLKAQQEQEIFHVLVHCLQQERGYNPYYAFLASHFCQADRKHQVIKYNSQDSLITCFPPKKGTLLINLVISITIINRIENIIYLIIIDNIRILNRSKII